jgi:RimJ/RimL family protein N-acetyltransferase
MKSKTLTWLHAQLECTFIILDKSSHKMVGDVNLFLNQDEDSSAEIEVMIAEEEFRGKGYGKKALRMMMSYAISDLGIHHFVAKISLKNEPSRKLFEKLGFELVKISEIFQEAELHLNTKGDLTHPSLGSLSLSREAWST